MRILLFSEITLFKYNVSTILSPIVTLIHQDLGDLEQAKEYQQRALAIKLKKLGAEHVSVATSY